MFYLQVLLVLMFSGVKSVNYESQILEEFRKNLKEDVDRFECQREVLSNISSERDNFIEYHLDIKNTNHLEEATQLGKKETFEKLVCKDYYEAIFGSLLYYLKRVDIESNEDHRLFDSMIKNVARIETQINEYPDKIYQVKLLQFEAERNLIYYMHYTKYTNSELSELGVFPDMLKKHDNLENIIDMFEKDLKNLGQNIDDIKKELDDLHETKEELESNIIYNVKEYLNKHLVDD